MYRRTRIVGCVAVAVVDNPRRLRLERFEQLFVHDRQTLSRVHRHHGGKRRANGVAADVERRVQRAAGNEARSRQVGLQAR